MEKLKTIKRECSVEFEEKPAEPKSTKASMGIYIFDWARLRNMLVAAEKSDIDMSDFGKKNLTEDKDLVYSSAEVGKFINNYDTRRYEEYSFSSLSALHKQTSP